MQWQFQRGLDRHARNNIIASRIELPEITLGQAASNPQEHEWQTVRASGRFNLTKQILLRNHYNEGAYGFELLTEFVSQDGMKFWVDCGWVKAGATATAQPKLPTLPVQPVSITGRLRLDSSLPQGAFFAIPSSHSSGLIAKANAQTGESTSGFYIDLLQGSLPSLTPTVPAELPELSDGPHMAYAVQWLLFAALIGYGRWLIRRESLQ